MGNTRKLTKTRRVLNLIFVGLEIIAWIALGTACMLYLRAKGHSDSVSVIPLLVGIALSILYAVRITNDLKLSLVEQNESIIQRLDDIEARLMGKPVQKKNDIDEIEKELKAVEDRMVKSVADLDKSKKSKKQAKSSEEKAIQHADNKAKAESIGLFAKLKDALNKNKPEEAAASPEKTAAKKPAKKSADKTDKTSEKPAEKKPAKKTAKEEKSDKAEKAAEKPAAKKTTEKKTPAKSAAKKLAAKKSAK